MLFFSDILESINRQMETTFKTVWKKNPFRNHIQQVIFNFVFLKWQFSISPPRDLYSILFWNTTFDLYIWGICFLSFLGCPMCFSKTLGGSLLRRRGISFSLTLTARSHPLESTLPLSSLSSSCGFFLSHLLYIKCGFNPK